MDLPQAVLLRLWLLQISQEIITNKPISGATLKLSLQRKIRRKSNELKQLVQIQDNKIAINVTRKVHYLKNDFPVWKKVIGFMLTICIICKCNAAID